jgi:hypothetical protein
MLLETQAALSPGRDRRYPARNDRDRGLPMLRYIKNVKPEDWPAVLLRGTALVLIVVHLFTFFFIYQHLIFILTALVMGLLLAREMYEDLSQRFFKLKAEEYEKDLADLQEHTHPAEHRGLLIEGTPSMKEITDRKSRG